MGGGGRRWLEARQTTQIRRSVEPMLKNVSYSEIMRVRYWLQARETTKITRSMELMAAK